MSGVSMNITYRFRRDISQKINRMPLRYFDGTNHGEVLSRVTNDVDTVSQTLNQSLTQIITSVTTVLGVLVMMLSISWQMTLVALAIIPISLVIIGLIVSTSQMYFKRQQDYLGHVNGHVEEMYGGHVVMKAFNGEEKSVEKFDGLNNTLYDSAWKSQFLSGLMFPIMNFVGNLGYVAICILGGYLAVRNADHRRRHPGVHPVRAPVHPADHPDRQHLQRLPADRRRRPSACSSSWPKPEEIPDAAQPDPAGRSAGPCGVQARPLRLQPGQNHHQRLFSATVEPGQRIAIVGPTGAGKTTMVKLLMRFYDVNSGAILVDGHDIREFTRDDLRCMFGMVLQDTWLYNGTHHGEHPLRPARRQRRGGDRRGPKPPTRITSSAPCRTATTWCSTRRPPTSPRARSS